MVDFFFRSGPARGMYAWKMKKADKKGVNVAIKEDVLGIYRNGLKHIFNFEKRNFLV